ncbi:GspE/PulE family protein [Methylophilus sp. OH31]|uniref:GspE/PulE family protein n=1 Tax=Methylophilus sp. OH31 TaxID=1387312 RepID=UPI00046303CC|nr:GspE/PulE family protein [Methylophilus sp. OH31]
MNMQDLPLTGHVPPLDAGLLPQARQLSQQTGRPLMEVLEELSGLTPDVFVLALGQCMHYPTLTALDLHAMQPMFDLLRFNDASTLHAVLMQKSDQSLYPDQSLYLVLADPFDEPLQLRLQSMVRVPVQWCLAHRNDIAACLQFHETQMRAMDQVHASDSIGSEEETPVEELSLKSISEDSSPVVRFVRSTLYDALKAGASDIHLESTLQGLRVKYRIDGVLTEAGGLSGVMQAEQAVSRIKVMSELDIAERRIPQDGRCKVHALGREIDLRVSIMPSVVGEDAVLRVLDRKALSEAQGISLEVLGFAPALLAQIRAQAEAPYGMLLVTGPTGSGKTTTLYGMISEINQGQDKIITIEDPVEYQLPGVLQIPVNEKKGLTFARGLRSILRHDPDKIMVGEIRDGETAQIAVQSALTGHLVLTTVHANNVFDVIGRFTNMGVDAYSFVSAVNVILAQRLVRVICPFCKVDDMPDSALLVKSGLSVETTQHYQFKKGQGCGQCHGSGYKGRKGIAELLLFDDRMRELIVSKAPISQIKALAATTGTRAMRDAGLALVATGETTLQEINRVTALS